LLDRLARVVVPGIDLERLAVARDRAIALACDRVGLYQDVAVEAFD
jgi:hypothetical protein